MFKEFMKKFIIVFVSLFINSVMSFASGYDSIEIDTTLCRYIQNGKQCFRKKVEGTEYCKYHKNAVNQCEFISNFGNRCEKKKYGDNEFCEKHLKQMYENNSQTIEDTKLDANINHIISAGESLKMAGKLRYAALGCTIAGGAICGLATIPDDDCTKGAVMITGGVIGVCGIICEICSMHYTMKSGKSLIIAGNHIQYNF